MNKAAALLLSIFIARYLAAILLVLGVTWTVHTLTRLL